jgi:hypothetical protein
LPELQVHRIETARCSHRPRAVSAGWRARLATWLLFFTAALLPLIAQADRPEFTEFDVARSEDGLQLTFSVYFELPHGVEDALIKGVPLYFVAEAEVFRDRWYWRDKLINKVTRVWRVAYQPLTRKYRVTFGGLNQSFETLADALSAVRRVSGWKLAEPGQIEEGSRHYVEMSYRLDTTLLPRPMQIGIGGQPEWTLLVEKVQRFN